MFAFGSWQGAAGSQRLELTVANVGTTGYHCKELPAGSHERGTPGSQPGNHGLPLQATAGYQRLELMPPNLGTIGYHCKELPVPKRLELMVPNVGTKGYHGKELPVPRP